MSHATTPVKPNLKTFIHSSNRCWNEKFPENMQIIFFLTFFSSFFFCPESFVLYAHFWGRTENIGQNQQIWKKIFFGFAVEFSQLALYTTRKLWILIDHFQSPNRFNWRRTLCFWRWQTPSFLFCSHFFVQIAPLLVNSHKIVKKIAGRWLVNAVDFSRRGMQIWEPESKIIAPLAKNYRTQFFFMTSIHFFLLPFVEEIYKKTRNQKAFEWHCGFT